MKPGDEAIARSVTYAALFDYPLTLSQLRRTLIASTQTPSEILRSLHTSAELRTVVEARDGYFFPVGRGDLVDVRRGREARSRAFLAGHRPLLRAIAMLPYVSLVALSGSIAHLNLEAGGDLDLFIVTRGPRVWSTAVAIVLLAKLAGRRRTLCANFIVSDTSLVFAQQDLFAANQIVGMKPIVGEGTFRALVAANPFVHRFYPNFHAPDCGDLPLRPWRLTRLAKRCAEAVLVVPSHIAEHICRAAYRSYLKRRSSRWDSPDQVVLGDTVLKLHTRSHRSAVLSRFDAALAPLNRA